jgi:hypothetical protein
MNTEEDEEFKRIERESGWRKRQILKQEGHMKIELEHFKDNDDGSCNVTLTTDNEANLFLIRYGLVAALTDAINKAKEEYTPKDQEPSDNQLINLQEELKSMREILGTYDEELRAANELIVRLQKPPLSEERIVALYRRSMDWRQFARDIEEEHGIKHKPIDISVPEEDGYDE